MRGSTLLAWAALILGLYYGAVGEPYLARMYAYPLEHRDIVYSQAKANKVPFSLVAAVILAESKFDESAQSAPGAMGLMQLMPDTAHWIAEQLNQPTMTDADIREPETNIKLGTWYLAYLLQEFKGNEILALAAYNAGRGHVEEWMQTYGWTDDFNRIDDIPFGETREYVNTVLKNKAHYEQLYDEVSIR
ncbi:lytic transglycosylase domain-containing protein [uncultured Veillonella sp.]|uniref:lytic transglycosylase domain-containing protein n=1 Tax=uncultured Veillonella sp. TaxID=159268 RepID=UPI00261754C2|nr:lytic transglycosylase domain-containing protein [uncultured Veillonella sp.]